MNLTDLAAEYRDSAALIRERVMCLRRTLVEEPMCETEKLRMRLRIDKLNSIFRETSEAALFMERYYDRRYRKNGRFTI